MTVCDQADLEVWHDLFVSRSSPGKPRLSDIRSELRQLRQLIAMPPFATAFPYPPIHNLYPFTKLP